MPSPPTTSLAAFIRFMYCPSFDLDQAVPLTADQPTTAEAALSPAGYHPTGELLELTEVFHPYKPGRYWVVSPPLLRRIDHLGGARQQALLMLVYVNESKQ